MKVNFAKPLYRWLPFEISQDKVYVELDVDSISENFLRDLLAMLTRIWNGEDTVCMTFLNPKLTHFQWLDGMKFRIATSEYLDRIPCYIDNETLAEFHTTSKELCIAFWRGLRDFESKVTPEEYAEHWGGEFPSQSLQILTDLIKEDKGKS